MGVGRGVKVEEREAAEEKIDREEWTRRWKEWGDLEAIE